MVRKDMNNEHERPSNFSSRRYHQPSSQCFSTDMVY